MPCAPRPLHWLGAAGLDEDADRALLLAAAAAAAAGVAAASASARACVQLPQPEPRLRSLPACWIRRLPQKAFGELANSGGSKEEAGAKPGRDGDRGRRDSRGDGRDDRRRGPGGRGGRDGDEREGGRGGRGGGDKPGGGDKKPGASVSQDLQKLVGLIKRERFEPAIVFSFSRRWVGSRAQLPAWSARLPAGPGLPGGCRLLSAAGVWTCVAGRRAARARAGAHASTVRRRP